MELKRDRDKKKGAMLQIWLMLLVMGIVLASGFFLIPKTEEERQEMMSFLGTTNTGEIITPVADFSSLAPGLRFELRDIFSQIYLKPLSK